MPPRALGLLVILALDLLVAPLAAAPPSGKIPRIGVPRPALVGAGLLILVTILLAWGARLTGAGQTVLPAPDSGATAEPATEPTSEPTEPTSEPTDEPTPVTAAHAAEAGQPAPQETPSDN